MANGVRSKDYSGSAIGKRIMGNYFDWLVTSPSERCTFSVDGNLAAICRQRELRTDDSGVPGCDAVSLC